MTWLPREYQLRQGAVFRMPYQFGEEGEKFRYFLVMNAKPQSDKLIILVTTTTQHIKRQAAWGEEADSILVGIHPADYPDVERFCVVDCRACRAWEKEHLLTVMEKRGAAFLSLLPEAILERILGNIARDKTIAASMKELIVP